MPTEKKYCEDCKFFVRNETGLSYARCSNPQARPSSTDHYVARALDKPPFAATMRIDQCGNNAAWFEAAEKVSV